MLDRAKWIWRKQDNPGPYNQTVVFRKTFVIGAYDAAQIAITADTRFRLVVNGEWVNDGPCRSWPEHYQYDVIDLTRVLHDGENEIEVIARYFGCGTFHQIPQQAGLLAQVTFTLENGETQTIATDETWEVAEAPAWVRDTPQQSIQMGPFEIYDARLDMGSFESAAVLCEADQGPWKDLNPRDVALLSKIPVSFQSLYGASVVEADWMCYTFPIARLMYPGVIEANHHLSAAGGFATVVHAKAAGELHLITEGLEVEINGKRGKNDIYQLNKGPNFLWAITSNYFGHWSKDVTIRFVTTSGFRLVNPLDGSEETPWCFAPFEEARYRSADYTFALLPKEERDAIEKRIRHALSVARREVNDAASLRQTYGDAIVTLKPGEAMPEPHRRFVMRDPLADAADRIEGPMHLAQPDGQVTRIMPRAQGDVELCYDLGEQNCGYYELKLDAEEGLILDLFGVEYITQNGTVQHTGEYRNGMRYICREGDNHFVSLMRRSQRYLFVTLRNQNRPVEIDCIRLIESTYPVDEIGRFTCSDPALDRIWEISAHTLKLCMEDTFTDCPLYEQTLWVGDARNEALFAMTAFGGEDVARRCIRLAGQSLERHPMVLCQVPSTWETLIPAWSFLWGISIWDYYAYTGDAEFVRECWPWIVKNLEGAEAFTNDDGLLGAPLWNFFDWSGIDDGHATVLHCSMFAVGAIDAALKCAEAIGETESVPWLRAYRERLVTGINSLWSNERGGYPDSVHEDGSPSESMSVHTHFLALLFDIVEPENRAKSLDNVLNPPEGMVQIGSPFAILYMYEALEKLGQPDAILDSIEKSYQPMLDLDATSVWESFASGTTGPGEFPTRSHTHAWSSAPIHFLNRIVLGIQPTSIGGTAYTISPRVDRVTHAEGASAGHTGPVTVSWKRDGDRLDIRAEGPADAKLTYVPNDTHEGYTVTFNGRTI